MPSLLAEDASELYAQNQYHLLELIMKDNIITIDWMTRSWPRPCLTHDGTLTVDRPGPTKPPAGGANTPAHRVSRTGAKPVAQPAHKVT